MLQNKIHVLLEIILRKIRGNTIKPNLITKPRDKRSILKILLKVYFYTVRKIKGKKAGDKILRLEWKLSETFLLLFSSFHVSLLLFLLLTNTTFLANKKLWRYFMLMYIFQRLWKSFLFCSRFIIFFKLNTGKFFKKLSKIIISKLVKECSLFPSKERRFFQSVSKETQMLLFGVKRSFVFFTISKLHRTNVLVFLLQSLKRLRYCAYFIAEHSRSFYI